MTFLIERSPMDIFLFLDGGFWGSNYAFYTSRTIFNGYFGPDFTTSITSSTAERIPTTGHFAGSSPKKKKKVTDKFSRFFAFDDDSSKLNDSQNSQSILAQNEFFFSNRLNVIMRC